MTDAPDLELRNAPDEMQIDERPLGLGRWIVGWVFVGVVLLIVAAGTAYYFYSRNSGRPASQSPPAAAIQPAPAQARPLGGQPEAIAVPPLDESDPVVRELVRRITSHPEALRWLATQGLIRSFTVVVQNVVDGQTPARQLTVLRPATSFRVVERDGQTFIDPRSYDRYDRLADAAASIDPAGAARVYATLKPRIEDAYAELGRPAGSFDRALARAIVALLETPVVDGPVRVAPKGGIGYQYADAKLEDLTAAQKHLLRTGPRNVRQVQSALRQIALAIGIPAERLPHR